MSCDTSCVLSKIDEDDSQEIESTGPTLTDGL